MYIDFDSKASKLHPLLSVILLFVLFMLCFIIGNFVATGLLMLTYGYTLDMLNDLSHHPENYANARMAILLNQGVGTILFGFILTSYLWKRLVEKDHFVNFFNFNNNNVLFLLSIAMLVTVASMPLNSVFISMNQKLDLPPAFDDLELKIRAMEATTEKLVKYLVDFQSPLEIGMAILVIGLLTGIGEELIFRGAIQKKLVQWLHNPHLAIWLASAIFSFIHFQFYGFIPRMLLAALFGYMYYWSGNLWVPIIAHACNNSVTILASYFAQHSNYAEALTESDKMMPIPSILVSFMVTALLLYLFKKECRKLPKSSS